MGSVLLLLLYRTLVRVVESYLAMDTVVIIGDQLAHLDCESTSEYAIIQMSLAASSKIACILATVVLKVQCDRLEHANLIRRLSSYKGIGYAIPGGMFLFDPVDETKPVIRVDNWRNAFAHSVSMSEKGASDKWPENTALLVIRKSMPLY